MKRAIAVPRRTTLILLIFVISLPLPQSQADLVNLAMTEEEILKDAQKSNVDATNEATQSAILLAESADTATLAAQEFNDLKESAFVEVEQLEINISIWQDKFSVLKKFLMDVMSQVSKKAR